MSQPQLLAAVFNRRMLICVFTGFCSGLPLYILFQLVPAWLQDRGVSLAEIGLFALVGIPYTWKFLWAPFMDRFSLKRLGRRKGWMLLSQIMLLLLIGALGSFSPQQSLRAVALVALALAFFSASQDIVLDAYRRELLREEELGLGNSIHVQAYRISSLIPGSLALVLADHLPWASVFWLTAAFMLVGIIMALVIREPDTELPQLHGMSAVITAPFSEYIDRKRWRGAILVMLFMILYKLGDSMATALSTPFYLDLGFSKTEVGLVAKNAALWPAIGGGILGGLAMLKLGINRALWLFGLVQLFSILGFALLATSGPVLWLLALVIAFEYLGVGLGTAAFTAFIARETSRRFAATQFALFTAIAALPRTFVNATTGVIVETVGWTSFFLLCTALAVPGLLLLRWVAPRTARPDSAADGDTADSPVTAATEKTSARQFPPH